MFVSDFSVLLLLSAMLSELTVSTGRLQAGLCTQIRFLLLKFAGQTCRTAG